jgi:hypothetical protein
VYFFVTPLSFPASLSWSFWTIVAAILTLRGEQVRHFSFVLFPQIEVLFPRVDKLRP